MLGNESSHHYEQQAAVDPAGRGSCDRAAESVVPRDELTGEDSGDGASGGAGGAVATGGAVTGSFLVADEPESVEL